MFKIIEKLVVGILFPFIWIHHVLTNLFVNNSRSKSKLTLEEKMLQIREKEDNSLSLSC